MQRPPLAPIGLLILSLAAFRPADATTATGLSSFDGIEESSVRYDPIQRTFAPSHFKSIADEGGGVIRITLRYRTDGWDGDRDTQNRDRQRTEAKGLGPHQKNGDTFEYETTWRTDPAFHGTDRFCHVFQLKATDGDDGAPLITMSIDQEAHHASVRYWSGSARNSTVVRQLEYVPGAWETVRIRVKTSTGNDGEVLASVNGDEFKGVRGVAVYRSGSTDYRPKWGLYRGVHPGMDLPAEDYVEDRNITAEQIGGPAIHNAAMETTAREKARASIPAALDWLEAQPASPARAQSLGSIAALWADSAPAPAMDWAARLPDRETREDVEQRVYYRWAQQDFGGAMTWLRAHAPNPDLDPLLWYQATDSTLRYVDRAPALECASLMSDPAWRFRAYSHVIMIWARQPSEKAGALAYVQDQARLTAEQKASLAAAITAPRRPASGPGHTPGIN